MTRPACNIGGGFRLTTLALGRKRIYHERDEWPRPMDRRHRQRRPNPRPYRGRFLLPWLR